MSAQNITELGAGEKFSRLVLGVLGSREERLESFVVGGEDGEGAGALQVREHLAALRRLHGGEKGGVLQVVLHQDGGQLGLLFRGGGGVRRDATRPRVHGVSGLNEVALQHLVVVALGEGARGERGDEEHSKRGAEEAGHG